MHIFSDESVIVRRTGNMAELSDWVGRSPVSWKSRSVEKAMRISYFSQTWCTSGHVFHLYVMLEAGRKLSHPPPGTAGNCVSL